MATLRRSRQVRVMSQSPNPAAPQQVAPLLALATEFLRAGRPADAIAPLRGAAMLQPSNAIIHHDLGLACLEIGCVPDAIAAFERAVASNPRYGDAYFRLGIAQEKLGNIDEAIAAYERATKLLPSLTEAWFRSGALFYTLGRREQAIGCFRRAAMAGGNSLSRLGKARALLIEERNQEAEQALQETLAADPPGAKLFHEGQFEARRTRVPTFLGRRPDEPVDAACQIFYNKLLAVINSPALREGQWTLCNCSGWPDNTSFQRLGVWSWTNDDDRRLIIINLSDGAVQARVHLPWNDVGGKTWRLDDALSDATYEREGDEMRNDGLYVELAPWAGQILAFHAIGNSSKA